MVLSRDSVLATCVIFTCLVATLKHHLIQYVQPVTVSICNQYKKLFMRWFMLLLYEVFAVVCILPLQLISVGTSPISGAWKARVAGGYCRWTVRA